MANGKNEAGHGLINYNQINFSFLTLDYSYYQNFSPNEGKF